MTPDQVAKDLEGECAADDDNSPWCHTHQSYWPRLLGPECPVLTNHIELADRAMDAWREDMYDRVEALRSDDPDPDSSFTNGWDSALTNVLDLLR